LKKSHFFLRNLHNSSKQQNDDNEQKKRAAAGTAAVSRISRFPLCSAVAADQINFSGTQQSHQETDPTEKQQSQTAAARAVIAAYRRNIRRTALRAANFVFLTRYFIFEACRTPGTSR
jgi:hypothetical protein